MYFLGLENRILKRRYYKVASVELNKQAPAFEIEDLKGNKFKLSDFRGESNILIVLNRGFI